MSSPQRSAVVAGDSIFRRRYLVALLLNPFLPSPRLSSRPSPRLSSRPSLRPLPGPSPLFSAFCPIRLPLLFIFFPNLSSPQSLPPNFFLSPFFSPVYLSVFPSPKFLQMMINDIPYLIMSTEARYCQNTKAAF